MIIEKDFLRTFILELILVQKESVFDLDDNESVVLPSGFIVMLDELLKDDYNKAKYSSLMPIEDRQNWKFNITRELHDFIVSSGVKVQYEDTNMRIHMDRSAISKILFNDRISLEQKSKIASLAEDFLIIQNKVKPKQKQLV
jgi:hypothetical protein